MDVTVTCIRKEASPAEMRLRQSGFFQRLPAKPAVLRLCLAYRWAPNTAHLLNPLTGTARVAAWPRKAASAPATSRALHP